MGQRDKNNRRNTFLRQLQLLQDKDKHLITATQLCVIILLILLAACGIFTSKFSQTLAIVIGEISTNHIASIVAGLFAMVTGVAVTFASMELTEKRLLRTHDEKGELEKLRQLASRLAMATEEEYRKISVELHESIKTAEVKLNQSNQRSPRGGFWANLVLRDPDMEQHLGDIEEDYPDMVAELGLQGAMRWQRGEISRSYWAVLRKKAARLFQKRAIK